jgi:hypothetical protein
MRVKPAVLVEADADGQRRRPPLPAQQAFRGHAARKTPSSGQDAGRAIDGAGALRDRHRSTLRAARADPRHGPTHRRIRDQHERRSRHGEPAKRPRRLRARSRIEPKRATRRLEE